MLWTQAFENWLNCTIHVCDFIYQFIEAAKFLLLDPSTFSFFEGFPAVASCHWYGSRTNKRKLSKLCMVFKSGKCCLYFTSAFD